ncbi:hypothetical protein D9M69_646630 [compost metagenome]
MFGGIIDIINHRKAHAPKDNQQGDDDQKGVIEAIKRVMQPVMNNGESGAAKGSHRMKYREKPALRRICFKVAVNHHKNHKRTGYFHKKGIKQYPLQYRKQGTRLIQLYNIAEHQLVSQ